MFCKKTPVLGEKNHLFIFLGVRNKSGFVVGRNCWKRFMASRGFTSEIARLVQRTLANLGWKSGGTVVAKVVFCWGGLTRFFLSHYKLGGGFTYFRNFPDGLKPPTSK